MKRICVLVCVAFASILFITSCGGGNSFKSLTGRKMDNKDDIEYALKIIRNKVQEKKIIEASIDGSGSELENKLLYVQLLDLDDKENRVSTEIIGVAPENSNYRDYYPETLDPIVIKFRRPDPAQIPGIDPEMLNSDLLINGLEKAKAMLADIEDYKFKVVGGYNFEVVKGETICTIIIHTTKPSDSQYTSNYYYEIKFRVDKNGNVSLQE